MNEEPVLILEAKRKGGRPRAPEPGSTVSAWLPSSQHDRLVKLANQRGVSVSQIAKALIAVGLQRNRLP